MRLASRGLASAWVLPDKADMELVLDNLGCRRGGHMVFHGLSFRLAAGQAAQVRGPNGVGKSSLLRVLAGLVPLAAGEVRLGGVSLPSDRSAFQERVAYVGHLDAIKPALTVRQNLSAWAALFGAEPALVDTALAAFSLDPLADRPAAQCSAGQKRRLGLARLVVMDRPLWLLDEPTVSLDTVSTAVVAELVRTHLAGGGLVLIATHIDLGLGDCPVLEMQPPVPNAAAAEDAFLAGDWT
ncbi:MAG: heme ABC exporter ATP-binding protein CcmA [Paracoccaceae bacterium]